MKQKRVVMCWALIDGSHTYSLIGIPFEGITCFIRVQEAGGTHWDVLLKAEYGSPRITDIHVAGEYHGGDQINDDTILNICALEDSED